MFIFRLGLLIGSFWLAAAPQQSAAPPAVAIPSAAPQADLAVDEAAKLLSFRELDERMTVPVMFGTNGPFRFIIDTGAQSSVLSRELAARLALGAGPRVTLTSMTETSQVDTVVVPSLAVAEFGEQRLDAVPALGAVDIGAAGLLGLDMLQKRRVSIDFEKRVMRVRPARLRSERSDPDEIVVRARSAFGQLIVTDASYRGSSIRVVIDTGSQVSMGNSALRRIITRHQPTRPVTLTSVTGGKTVADYSNVSGISFGSIQFANLPIAFADVVPFQHFGLAGRPALLLGMDALESFRQVDIDFANREVRLLPPTDWVRFPAPG